MKNHLYWRGHADLRLHYYQASTICGDNAAQTSTRARGNNRIDMLGRLTPSVVDSQPVVEALAHSPSALVRTERGQPHACVCRPGTSTVHPLLTTRQLSMLIRSVV
eukprot:6227371-Amphidinium_carterae.1